jgi:hypothetical protein
MFNIEKSEGHDEATWISTSAVEISYSLCEEEKKKNVRMLHKLLQAKIEVLVIRAQP